MFIISEFVEINPKLQEHANGSESLASKLDKLLDLQDRISAILYVMLGALRLLSVEESCVAVTSEKQDTVEGKSSIHDVVQSWILNYMNIALIPEL